MLLPSESPPDVRSRPQLTLQTAPGALDGTVSVPDLASPDTHDLTEMAALSGAFVVRLEVGEVGETRTYLYRSISGAERAVQRATARGRSVAVYLCQLSPVGPVVL